MSDFTVQPAELHAAGVALTAYTSGASDLDLPGNFVIEDFDDAVTGLATRAAELAREGGGQVIALGDGLEAAASRYQIVDGWPE